MEQQRSVAKPFRLLMRVPVPWVFILVYLLGAALERTRPAVGGAHAPRGTSVAGAVVFAAGAVIAGWGWILFWKARTTRVPGETSSRLVTWGPYRFTRNPMYVGLILAYLGEAGIQRQLWPAVLLPLVVAYVNSVVIPVEETRLAATFGEEYEQYRARVRRWI